MSEELMLALVFVAFSLGVAVGGFMMWRILTKLFQERLDQLIKDLSHGR